MKGCAPRLFFEMEGKCNSEMAYCTSTSSLRLVTSQQGAVELTIIFLIENEGRWTLKDYSVKPTVLNK